MGIAYNTSIVRDGLVLHLDAANVKSYPGSGTVWTDLSGNGNNGTLVNSVGYSSDNKGSLTFDGINDFSTHPTLLYVESFTINSWVLKNTTSIQTIVAKGGSDFNLNFYLRINGNSGFKSSSQFVEINIPDIALNVWTNIFLTYDKNKLKYGINGNFINEVSSDLSPIAVNNDIIIGRLGDFNGQFWNGNISQVQIYNRALTTQEIRQNFEATRGRYGI